MKAVVKYGQQADMVEIRDVPEPAVRSGTVLIQVKAASVCGWDIEMWKHNMANPVTVPVIQGHEFSGVVASVGEGVREFTKGDRVTCETTAVACGACHWCRTGDYQVCPERKGFGYGVDGAFTKYVVARKEIVHALPDGLSFEEGALTEPFCVVHHALTDRVTIASGDCVVVIGPGPIGLIALQTARLAGVAQTVLIGLSGDRVRMELAGEKKWADALVYADKENVQAVVSAATGGRGADVVADCAGNSPAFKTALDIVRRCGQIVKIGWGPKPFNYSLDDLLRKSVTVAGTFGHNYRNWEAVLKLFATRRLDPKSLITGVKPLSKWKEAFEMVESCQAVKMILVPED
jgi:alcohol dehydrogenase/L-iditol 2-dehydrogenase